LLKDDDLLAAIEQDWRSSSIDGRRMAMLTYVEKLTARPQDVIADDVDALRSAGFTDQDVHDICEVAAYYAYVNRVADGLGVQLETWLPDD
jgi:uncharacterized peroxidase-related enzyme